VYQCDRIRPSLPATGRSAARDMEREARLLERLLHGRTGVPIHPRDLPLEPYLAAGAPRRLSVAAADGEGGGQPPKKTTNTVFLSG